MYLTMPCCSETCNSASSNSAAQRSIETLKCQY